MAEGLSSYLATAILDAVGNNVALAVPQSYIKLHVGTPGAAGTANPAVETTRKAISFAAAGAGAMSNDAAVQWTSVSGSEDYTHWTCWDDLTAGNFLFSGVVTANAVLTGDTFTIPVGDIDVTFPLAS